jgi:hypothetical protein
LRAAEECHDIGLESPLLLDPLVEGDPRLLYFEDDGRVVPTFLQTPDVLASTRAEVSIELYHLNHALITRARKRLHDKVAILVREGDACFSDGVEDERVRHARHSVIERIYEVISSREQYSAASKAYLSRFKETSTRPWLEAVLGEVDDADT